jgi:hypothetical protein
VGRNPHLFHLSLTSSSSPNLPYTTHRLLFGTHTSGQTQDFLQIATLQLPKRDAESLGLDRTDYDHDRGGVSRIAFLETFLVK